MSGGGGEAKVGNDPVRLIVVGGWGEELLSCGVYMTDHVAKKRKITFPSDIQISNLSMLVNVNIIFKQKVASPAFKIYNGRITRMEKYEKNVFVCFSMINPCHEQNQFLRFVMSLLMQKSEQT